MKFVAYYRVSTAKQGRSGLGLEAQQHAVEAFARGSRIVASFTEVETGKRACRPELTRAIELCRRERATLVIAKLDRLARNVAFTAALMDSGVEFVACDAPHASRLTIHVLAAVAEDEARRVSERTKAALAAVKRRGVKLGNPSPAAAAKRGNRVNVTRANDYAATVRPLASKKRKAGWTLQQIAHHLTGVGILTRTGKAWSSTAVLRLLA